MFFKTQYFIFKFTPTCIAWLLCFGLISALTGSEQEDVNHDLADKPDDDYVEAVNGTTDSSRRNINVDKFGMHVQKLKAVNGLKMHNLNIHKGLRGNDDKLIYINNPLESHIPNAFISIDEYKKIMADKLRKEKDSVGKPMHTVTRKTTKHRIKSNHQYKHRQKHKLRSTTIGNHVKKNTESPIKTVKEEKYSKGKDKSIKTTPVQLIKNKIKLSTQPVVVFTKQPRETVSDPKATTKKLTIPNSTSTIQKSSKTENSLNTTSPIKIKVKSENITNHYKSMTKGLVSSVTFDDITTNAIANKLTTEEPVTTKEITPDTEQEIETTSKSSIEFTTNDYILVGSISVNQKQDTTVELATEPTHKLVADEDTVLRPTMDKTTESEYEYDSEEEATITKSTKKEKRFKPATLGRPHVFLSNNY
ncbi:hypothetical protein JYU34_010290 [Plutella xylostella]|uniref:Uncharacterized protein n=1 Tax=Plutella xylostella TaxID=51655 RepID=A0ABQ7QIL5_PLUXY|nr:hypothetical protein JYU34_010290 [Plutella xylostella]